MRIAGVFEPLREIGGAVGLDELLVGLERDRRVRADLATALGDISPQGGEVSVLSDGQQPALHLPPRLQQGCRGDDVDHAMSEVGIPRAAG